MQRLSHSWEKLRSWSTIAFIVNENMSSQYALLEFSQSFIISHWLKMRSPHLSNYKAYSKFKWGNDLVSEQFPPFFRICFSSKYSKIYTTTAVIYLLIWIDPIFHLYCHIFYYQSCYWGTGINLHIFRIGLSISVKMFNFSLWR
jgi:hypothetical protein